jgi:hypothetical protein
MEEREYSILEIVKVNIKNWKIVLLFMMVCAFLLGVYQYKTVHPMEVKYSQTTQMNSSFYMKEYNSESIVERFLSVKALGQSYEAYQMFGELSGYELSYEGYTQLFSFVDDQYIDVQQFYFSYPESYDTLSIQTEEEALAIADCLGQVLVNMCSRYIGDGAVSILDKGYTTVVTHVEAGTPTSKKDVLFAVGKGVIAGAFFGFVIAFLVISLGYMMGTVTKTANEIRAGLGVPVLAFVRGKGNHEEEIKKERLFFDGDTRYLINYMTYGKLKYNGAQELASCFEKSGKNVVLIGQGDETLKRYRNGTTGQHEIKAYLDEKTRQYDIVIIDSPNLQESSDGYAIAKLCPENILAFQRRRMSGTNLEDIRNTIEVNRIHLTGAVIYGN